MIYEEGDYFGRTVNIAARIASQAGPDQVFVGEDALPHITPSGFRLVEVGAFELKGIAKPLILYEAIRDDVLSATSPRPKGDRPSMRRPSLGESSWALLQAASPLAFWWLDPATVYALGLAVIAFVYIGFAVADGRWRVIAVECGVAMAFVVIAAAGITGSAWLLVVGFAAHGVKDAWQQRSQYVSGTRWWPPFCAAVDWVVALIIAIEIVAGIHLRP